MSDSTVKHIFFQSGLFFLYLCCFFLPVSSALMNISSGGFILCWLLSKEIVQFPRTIRQNWITWPPLLLFVLLVIGIFYSTANWQESLEIFKKYRELIYFPIVLSLLQADQKKHRKNTAAKSAQNALLAGMTTLMLISYAMYWGWLTTEKFGYSTIHHITHSFFMAILSFWALQKLIFALISKNKDKIWHNTFFLLLFLLATVNLFFISAGRTGMVLCTLLIILSILQRLKFSQTILSVFLICTIITGTYQISDNFSNRVDEAIEDIQNYQPGESRSSLGMRFDWWQNSICLIKQAPLTGYGTGSFATEQHKLTTGTPTMTSDNPHNEYLLLGVQLGFPGIAIFLLLLVTLFYISFSLPKEDKVLLQGIVLAFAWGCLANSWLLDSHSSHLFMIVTAVLVSKKQNKTISDNREDLTKN